MNVKMSSIHSLQFAPANHFKMVINGKTNNREEQQRREEKRKKSEHQVKCVTWKMENGTNAVILIKFLPHSAIHPHTRTHTQAQRQTESLILHAPIQCVKLFFNSHHTASASPSFSYILSPFIECYSTAFKMQKKREKTVKNKWTFESETSNKCIGLAAHVVCVSIRPVQTWYASCSSFNCGNLSEFRWLFKITIAAIASHITNYRVVDII